MTSKQQFLSSAKSDKDHREHSSFSQVRFVCRAATPAPGCLTGTLPDFTHPFPHLEDAAKPERSGWLSCLSFSSWAA